VINKEFILKELGLTEEQWKALSKREQDKRLLALRKKWMS
jgi:hypothetical protein